jgi:hypothetical protein
MSPLILSALLFLFQASPQVENPAEKGAAHAAPAGLEVSWARTWEDAVSIARGLPSGNGRILIELVDEDCGECSRMEALIAPSTSFYSFTRDKVPVRVTRSSPDGQMLTRRLAIRSVPAWVVVTPDLVISGLQVGATSQSSWVEAFAKSEKSWSGYLSRLEAERRTPADLELVFAVAVETFKRGGDSSAESRFRRLSTSAGASPAMREKCLAFLATIEMDSGRHDDAVRDLDTILAGSGDPGIREKAELRRAEVEIARGRKDLAAARLKDFKKNHPDSSNIADVDRLLNMLRPALEEK